MLHLFGDLLKFEFFFIAPYDQIPSVSLGKLSLFVADRRFHL